MSRKRRSFTTEYKVEAAHRVIDSGRTVVEVSRELPFGAALLDRTDGGRLPADVLPVLASIIPQSPPGTTHLYSSLNYLVLAAVIRSAGVGRRCHRRASAGTR